MLHRSFSIALLALVVPAAAVAARPDAIIPEEVAARHGLARPWMTQTQVGPGTARLTHMALYGDILYVQSDRGQVQAVDAETGATLWLKQVGNPDYPTLRVGVGADMIGVINGSTLYVLNRYNGDRLYDRQLEYAPGAGPAISSRYAYVPMLSGLLVGHRLEPVTDPLAELGFEEPTELTEAEEAAREQRRRENIRIDQEYKATVAAQSSGHITVQPTATLDTKDDEYVAWVTDRGHLNAGYIDPSEPNHIATKYQIEASGDVLAPPTFLPPAPDAKKGAGILYIASEDGFVYAIDQATGDSVWRHSTGEPILERVALVFPHVYVCNQLGGMHCLDALTGERVWWAPKIKKFLAASEQYVYAIDIHERLVSLDRATGAWIDMMPLGPTAVALQNDRTDRVYLATESGLVQCLHQLGVDEPIRHNRVSPGAEQAADQGEAGPEAEQPTAQPAAPTQPAPAQPEPAAEEEPAADPFGGGGNPFGGANDDGGGNPFGGADTNPFGGDNPFAG